MLLRDNEARKRFVEDLENNFIVVAPAGVGKTRAIVDRVVNTTMKLDDANVLSKLAVVTYTNKAADEMQLRARNSLLEKTTGSLRVGNFNRIFFGTIHSFCLNLLRSYGHYLGIPAGIELITDEDEEPLWTEFARTLRFAGFTGRDRELIEKCFRHLPAQQIIELASRLRCTPRAGRALDSFPDPDLEPAIKYDGGKGASRKNMEKSQDILKKWKSDLEGGAAYLPLPSPLTSAAEFVRIWNEAFDPARRWLARASLQVAGRIAADYRAFRIARGKLTYADQINLVLDLAKHPAAGPALRGEGHRVILDEAQDTDPDQFRVLLELARPANAKEIWTEDGGVPPRKGHFCMVGDPQQSIYGSRTDISFYTEVSKKLIAQSAAEELTFHVTFRCAKAVTKAANALCPGMLTGENGQVKYVELYPRPEAPEGSAVRWTLPAPEPGKEEIAGVDAQTEYEAGALAEWIAGTGCRGLGASDWSQVAILCPRKKWLFPIEFALKARSLEVQNHSSHEKSADSPANSWFTALMVCIAEPENSFEIVGLLREVFGIADTDLYDYARGNGSLFRITEKARGRNPAADALNLLHDARLKAMDLPLLDAAEHLLSAALLRKRLAALDTETGEVSGRILDVLLAQTALAEADGKCFSDWAEELKRSVGVPLETPTIRKKAIQLMTCHGAKGLEWDAVILPLFFRHIATASENYPRVIENRHKKETTVAFSSDWLDEEDSERIDRGINQETQRLLYVSMTRARNTVVMVDDRAIFRKAKNSFASCLGLTEEKPPAEWQKIGHKPGVFKSAANRGKGKESAPELRFGPPVKDLLSKAGKAAGLFPRRILPHSLARHPVDHEPEKTANLDPDWAKAIEPDLIEYGIMWHGLMEILDWSNRKSWSKSFEQAFGGSPMLGRARKEWELFLKSDAARLLGESGYLVRTEAPFLSAISGTECVEGVIDIVARNADGNRWLVLDWKTNVLEGQEPAVLLDIYTPQIAEYVNAIRKFAGPAAGITALLYSTSSGATLEV